MRVIFYNYWMSQQGDRRDQGSPHFTRVNKDDSAYQYQQDRSKWRKKAWTEQQDQFLMRLVAKHGAQKWTVIAQNLPGRVGKQCRERWHNHLNPEIKKDEWGEQEEWMLFLLHKNLGNQWANFTKSLKGRTDNAIKNHWNSIMRKRAPQYMERYKRIKATLQASKQSKGQQIDAYLMEKLGDQLGLNEMQRWQGGNQKHKIKEQVLIKSMDTVVKKKSVENIMDSQKTVKKKCRESSIERNEETTKKQNKKNQFNFNIIKFNTRLSQMSIFGVQSQPHMASAFSLLEQPEPVVLQPQPSFNDISLSIHCFQDQKEQEEEHSLQKGRYPQAQSYHMKMDSRRSLPRMRKEQCSILKHS